MRGPDTLLLVRHGHGRVGVDLAGVREVLRMVAVKALPGAPHGVLGVMNLRGETIAVLDLEARLPAGAGKPGVDHHLVVLAQGSVPVALAVSHVDDIEALGDGVWRAAGDVLPHGVPISGVARFGDELVPVLDPMMLLEEGEIIALREAVEKLRKAGRK